MGTSFSIFAIPKAFKGHIGVIQRNAIKSWTLLNPRPKIILFGNEEGVGQIAANFGLTHIPEVERNEYGTPLLHDLFARAQQAVGEDSLLAYVNSDIIFFDNFLHAVGLVRKNFQRFLMVGQRIDYSQASLLDFESRQWAKELMAKAGRLGSPHNQEGMDYFVFTPGLWPQIPPFAIGRCAWDGWLLDNAAEQGAATINASAFSPVIHQNHAYSHAGGGRDEIWSGQEAARNRELAGKMSRTACYDADFALQPDGSMIKSAPEPLLREQAWWRKERVAWFMLQARFFLENGLPETASAMLDEAQAIPHRGRDKRKMDSLRAWARHGKSMYYKKFLHLTLKTVIQKLTACVEAK